MTTADSHNVNIIRMHVNTKTSCKYKYKTGKFPTFTKHYHIMKETGQELLVRIRHPIKTLMQRKLNDFH